MKRLLLLILIALVLFIAVFRQRLFLRDPIATVKRDGVKQGDVRVMINYTNDVLIDDSSTSTRRLYIVQGWNKIAATPTVLLKCLTGVACMTDADQATATPIEVGSRGKREPFEGVTMTSRMVEFVDERGALVEVDLW